MRTLFDESHSPNRCLRFKKLCCACDAAKNSQPNCAPMALSSRQMMLRANKVRPGETLGDVSRENNLAGSARCIYARASRNRFVGNAHAAKQTDGPPATDSAMAIDRHGRVARRRIPLACIRRASAGQYSNPGDDPVTKSKHPRSVGDICRDGHCGKRHHLPDRAMSIYSIRPEV